MSLLIALGKLEDLPSFRTRLVLYSRISDIGNQHYILLTFTPWPMFTIKNRSYNMSRIRSKSASPLKHHLTQKQMQYYSHKLPLRMLPIFLITDQPTTCPHCSHRTQMLSETKTTTFIQQLHYCTYCHFLFIEEEQDTASNP